MLKERVVVGDYQTNCYILSIGQDCLVIDPGDEYDKIKSCISNKNVLAILLTHRHFDHIGALDLVSNYGKLKIYEYNNVKEEEYKIGPFSFKVIYIIEHTNDSITYNFKTENIMFKVDFLFEKRIGRIILQTGN